MATPYVLIKTLEEARDHKLSNSLPVKFRTALHTVNKKSQIQDDPVKTKPR